MDLKTIGLGLLSFVFVILYIIQKWDYSKLDEKRKNDIERYQGDMARKEIDYQDKLKALANEKKTLTKEVEVKKTTLDKTFNEKNLSADYWKQLNDESRAYHVEKMTAMKDHVRSSYELLIKEADEAFNRGDYKSAELFCRACIILKPLDDSSLRLKNRIEAFRIVNRLGMAFVKIPKGEFKMGSFPTEKMRGSDEDSHKVTITKDFFMMETEVTQEVWDAVMNTPKGELRPLALIKTPALAKGLGLPVENVSYHDVNNFIIKINQLDMGKFRLPTEAEWEYAARANEGGPFGDNGVPDPTTWYNRNSDKVTQIVRTKFPNKFGLYDMLGNVSEWVIDFYAPYTVETVIDPVITNSNGFRSYRGGSFKDSEAACRIANRNKAKDDFVAGNLGFRLIYQAN